MKIHMWAQATEPSIRLDFRCGILYNRPLSEQPKTEPDRASRHEGTGGRRQRKRTMERAVIVPGGPIVGRTRVVGSKSLSIRALEAAALARGSSSVLHAAECDDVDVFVAALFNLGVTIERREDGWRVEGLSGHWQPRTDHLDVGPAGTPFRFLMALAALSDRALTIDGSARMRERPVGPLAEALSQLGATVRFPVRPGYPPVVIRGDRLSGGALRLDAGSSSQFLSALLLIGPLLEEALLIEPSGEVASAPYVQLTCDVMAAFGAPVQRVGRQYQCQPGGYLACRYEVPGDASSAAYFFAAAAITRGDVTVEGLGDTQAQGDFALVDLLEKMGCQVDRSFGEIRVRGPERLRAVRADLNAIPDQVPTLAVVAAFADGETQIENVAHLRLKESDRLAAVAKGLEAVGIEARETPDGLIISGGTPHAGRIDPRDDHRLVMAFSILGLSAGPVTIDGSQCVSKSFRDFFSLLRQLGGAVETGEGATS